MMEQTKKQKTMDVNGVIVQLSFAPRTNEQVSQRVWELLKSIYAKQSREVATQ